MDIQDGGRMRDLYNCNTYILSWVEPDGEPRSKAYETRREARQRKSNLKKRLGKKRHIEIKKIVTTHGYIKDTSVVW